MSNSRLDSPPTFLLNAPRSLLKALDPSEALQAALSAANDDPAEYGPLLALGDIQSYLGAAKRQQRRIKRIKALLKNTARKGRPQLRDGLAGMFADVHFYLICWERVHKTGRFIQRATKFRRFGRVLRRYRSEFEIRRDARNHLEHFEERLPGGRRRDKQAVPNDLLNMRNEFLTFGSQQLDVGSNSIRLLTEIVGQLRTAILFDSLEQLRTTDEPRLVRLLKNAARNLYVARTTNQLKKMLSGRV